MGKPGSYYAGIDRVGNVKPMTVGARMFRVEQQLNSMEKKLDQVMHSINNLVIQQQQKPMSTYQYHHPNYHASVGPFTYSSPSFDNFQTTSHSQQVALPAGPSQTNTPMTSMNYQPPLRPPLEDDV